MTACEPGSGQLELWAQPKPNACLCWPHRTVVACHPAHCGVCDRCEDCGHCAGLGCTCECEQE